MKPELNSQLVGYRLSKAKETLGDADIMMKHNGSPRTTVNCLYYACMYSVLALLHTKGIYAKSHDGIKQMFGLHFIKEGILPLEMGEFYSRLLNRRITGDYDEFVNISQEELENLYQRAKEFIETVEDKISQSAQS